MSLILDTLLDCGRILQRAAGVRVVLRRQRRSETEDKNPAACSQPLVHMAGCLSVCSVCPSRLCCSRSCAQQSCPFRFHSWPCGNPARAALRAAPSCSPSPAVLQSAGRLQVKASSALCLVLRQPILRPGGSETSVERLSLSWVRRAPERGKAPQLHRIQASTSFCFSGFCQDWPTQSTARLDAPADPGHLLAVAVSAVGSIVHIYGFIMPVVMWDFQAFLM